MYSLVWEKEKFAVRGVGDEKCRVKNEWGGVFEWLGREDCWVLGAKIFLVQEVLGWSKDVSRKCARCDNYVVVNSQSLLLGYIKKTIRSHYELQCLKMWQLSCYKLAMYNESGAKD